jgi:heme exporter protein A
MDLIRNETLLQRLPATNLAAGECLMISGQNGAGKSTLLSRIAGLSSSASIQTHLPLRLIGHKLALVDELSVMENLALMYALDLKKPASDADLVGLLNQVGLTDRRHQPCTRLSAGQKRRLQLSRLWMRPPSPCLWLLDEPLTALDASFHQTLIRRMDELLKLGHGLVITSHQSILLKTQSVQNLAFGDLGAQAELSCA